jgi:hypothetical protein
MFYYRLKGLRKLENNFLNLFDENIVRYSYEDFIKTLHQIYLYDKSKTEKQKVKLKEKYNQMSKKLGYAFFSDSFIMEYFK